MLVLCYAHTSETKESILVLQLPFNIKVFKHNFAEIHLNNYHKRAGIVLVIVIGPGDEVHLCITIYLQ